MQTTSYTLSQQLQKRGVTASAEWYWHKREKVLYHVKDCVTSDRDFNRNFIPAYGLDTLISNVLPPAIRDAQFRLIREKKRWIACYWLEEKNRTITYADGRTPFEAVVMMVILFYKIKITNV